MLPKSHSHEHDGLTIRRVHISGIRGGPPPETTKLSVFYQGGYEMQALFNATGYGFDKKFELFSKQVRYFMGEDALKKLDILEFQKYGDTRLVPSRPVR